MVIGLEDLKKLSKPPETVDVELPGIGTARLMALGARERMALGIELSQQEETAGASEVFAKLWFDVLCASLVDGNGNRVFATAEGRAVLEGMKPADLMPAGTKALEINGFTQQAMSEALENAKKNSADAMTGTLPLTCASPLDGPTPTTSSAS